MTESFHPWRYAAEHYPEVTICRTARLPHPRVGATDYVSTIWLCSSLDTAGRRFTLTHELMHLDRGRVPKAMQEAEEKIVDQIAARLLIPMPALLDVVTRVEDVHAAAEALWVSPYGLRVRLSNLTHNERMLLTEARRGELAC